jgi:hypothetical protein
MMTRLRAVPFLMRTGHRQMNEAVRPPGENLMPTVHLQPLRPAATPVFVEPVSAAWPPRPRFSWELHDLARQFAGRPARLSEILAATQGRGFNLLLLLLGLPLLTPVPLPGVSTLFGLAVMLIGTQLALGRQPWLPEKILQRALPAQFIARLLGAASRIVRWLEVLLRPRLEFLHERWIYRRAAGTLIMLSGLLLLLPLPIPLTNCLPALTVVLLAAGAMERDGLFFLAGGASFGLTLVYFGLLAFGGAHLLDQLQHTWITL